MLRFTTHCFAVVHRLTSLCSQCAPRRLFAVGVHLIFNILLRLHLSAHQPLPSICGRFINYSHLQKNILQILTFHTMLSHIDLSLLVCTPSLTKLSSNCRWSISALGRGKCRYISPVRLLSIFAAGDLSVTLVLAAQRNFSLLKKAFQIFIHLCF